MGSRLVLGSLETGLVPGEVTYSVLMPPGRDSESEPLPLLVNMHGGGLDRDFLAETEIRDLYDGLWEEGALPPMVVACYSARGSWHLNYRDGSERWEDFAFAFIDHMVRSFNVRPRAAYTYLTGISMGAMGSLRLALKYPDRIGAVAAMEGVINPVLRYEDLEPRNYGMQHNGAPELQRPRWGWPVDRDYYHANNHANIAESNAPAIRRHAPKIYLECGDRDYYNAHDGAEFLHRVLWANRIEHEYRLLHGCDHVGASLMWRMEEAHRWLGRMSHRLTQPRALPEPTRSQQRYMERAYRGEVVSPVEAGERLSIADDAAILAHRRALPDLLARYADAPLDGVFRNPHP